MECYKRRRRKPRASVEEKVRRTTERDRKRKIIFSLFPHLLFRA
jgi:hypothetical protein